MMNYQADKNKGAFNVPFENRKQAGDALAEVLNNCLKNQQLTDAFVLALPRGGVPVASQIAQRLSNDLDVLIVRKLGVPWQKEVAMGAIASGDIKVFNDDVLTMSRVTKAQLAQVIAKEEAELKRREATYRGDRPWPVLKGKTVILVDDGIATGATMLSAIMSLRKQNVAKIIVAIPVASKDALQRIHDESDEVICLVTPEYFGGVGSWYEYFDQTSDATVKSLLETAWQRQRPKTADDKK